MSANPYPQSGPPTFDPSFVTTALELPGYRIVRSLGVVRGIVVRSRNLFANLGAGLQTLCEKTRQDAFNMMIQHAAEHGANAVIMARYDANELMQGVTEVLAYGTAVIIEVNKA
jgi:uncharacterized protein YbjQ (UPF0145 family)